MFDLFRRRDRVVRWMLTALLLLVALSLVTYLIPGSGMPGGFDEQVVAEIGKEKLTLREVQLALTNASRERKIPSELMGVYVPQIIDNMVQDRAIAYEAQRLGFKVTEKELAEAIQSTLPQLFQDGKFVGRDVYSQFLAQQNLTVEQFEANFRKQILLTKLQGLVLEGMVVTPQEVEREYRRRNEKIKIDYIAFHPDKFRSQVTVTPEEMMKQYESRKAGLMLPERRSFDVIIVNDAKMAAQIQLSDDELRRIYLASQDRYRTEERVRARHILLKTMDKPAEEIPKLEARAKDLLKQLKGGADFAALAKQHSEDPGSAAKGGDLDWVTRGQMVPEFEKTAFSLKPKEISDVVKTQYGFHIVQVLEKQDARLKPFEEVKAELAAERRKALAYERVQTTAEAIRNALLKAPMETEAVAKQHGLTVTPVEKAKAGTPIPGLAENAELDGFLFSAKKGEVSPVIQTAGNTLVVAVVKEIFPAHQAEFKDVEKGIREALIREKAEALAKEKSAEAMKKLAAGGDMKAVAKAYGLEVKSTPEFDRAGAAEGLGPASYLEEGFLKPVGTLLNPVELSGQVFLVKVTSKSEADMGKFALERENMVASIKAQKARERDELFRDGLTQRLIKEGKIKMHDRVIKRLIASYSRG